MNQKFSKKELERLGCTEEEIKLVMDYQKKLPIIVDNDQIEHFCIYARDLHEQLKVGKHFTDWFYRRVKSYKFLENVDFSMVSPNGEIKEFGEGGDTRSKNYYITMDMAKQLSMLEKTDIGNLARRYYILMEKLVKDNKDWWTTRNPERKEYNDMCNALSENIHRHSGRYADKYDYSREANIINIIATGSEAQSIRNYFGLYNQNELTRDSLERDYNEKLAFLQKQNIIYLGMNIPIIERIKLLISAFDIIYPTASPVLPWLSRENMSKAREKLIERLSN